MNNRLTREVRDYLAPYGCGDVSVSGLVDGKLKLLVSNPTFATIVRYQQAELLKHLNTDPALNISHVSIRVSSSMNENSPVR